MDVIGAVTNIAHITRRVIEFVQGCRDGPKDRERLVNAVFQASGVVETFRILHEASKDASWESKIREMSGPQGALTRYRDLLQQIFNKAKPDDRAHSHKFTKKVDESWKRVTWPFGKSTVEPLVKEVNDIKMELSLAVCKLSLIFRIKVLTCPQLEGVQLEMGRSMQSSLDRIESKVEDLILGQATLLGDSDSAKLQGLKSWLSPIDAERSLQRNLRLYAESRPSWYLQDDTFRSWEAASASKRTLWCSGNPGAGKTVLASFLVAELRQRHARSNATTTAIFYCNYKPQERHEQTSTDIIRCLCRQLLEKHPGLRFRVEHYKDLMENGESSKEQEEEADEKSLMRDLLLHFDQSFIIIDGLDECGDRERTKLIRQLYAVLDETPGMRLLVTSRDNQNYLFPDTLHMAIVAKGEDIENYIRVRMENIDPLSALADVSPDEQVYVLKKVAERSLGIFLLVKGHMDALEECERKDTLRMKTKNLSGNVEEIYNDAWARIVDQREDRRNIGMSALLWVVRAKRVLRCDELLHAVAASTSEETDDFNDDAIATEKLLVASCGGLIMINPDTKFVTIHQSLQEYFEDGKRKTMLFPGAEQEMAKICLKYLRFQRFAQGHCRSQEEWNQRLSKNRFLEYAAQSWGWHVQTIDEASILVDVLGLLLSNAHLACAAETLARAPVVTDRVGGPGWMLPQFRLNYFSHRDIPIMPPLHLAAYFGLKKTVRALLDKGHDINERADSGRTAISVASMVGQKDTVRLLLDRGADPSIASDVCNLTPLHSAASANNIRVVQMLVDSDRRKDLVDRRDFHGRTALHDATARGHKDVVSVLLKAGADPLIATSGDQDEETAMHMAARMRKRKGIISKLFNAPKGGAASLQARTRRWKDLPIHKASTWGNPNGIKLLLDLGTPIESRQGTQRTPLHLACRWGRPQAVKVLLDRGADITAREVNDRTPLHIALLNDRSRVFDILLAHTSNSAHLELRSGPDGNTALLIAAKEGRPDSFRALLAAGADLVATNSREASTALHLASGESGDVSIVNQILERPEGQDLLEKCRSTSHRTALLDAAAFGRADVVRRLVEARADVAKKDIEGRTALKIAINHERHEVIKYLEARGASQ